MLKKKSVYKKICIIAVAVLLIVGYAIGFKYINSKFPQGNVKVIELGQTTEINGFRWKNVMGELLTRDEVSEKYGYEDDVTGYEEQHVNDIYLVMWVEVENLQDTDNKLEVMDFMGLKGTWSNGVDMYAFWTLNGDDFDAVVAPKSTTRIGALTTLTLNSNQTKNIIMDKNEWRLRVAGWPQRMEFVLPVEMSEGVKALL